MSITVPYTGVRRDPVFELIAVFCALTCFAAIQMIGVLRANGIFEYPLDDVYIHLSMAEQIAQGGYGINSGEYQSASSSPLFSLLLLPFSGTGFHRFLPLIWNTLGLAGSAFLWARLLVLAGYALPDLRKTGLLLAALGPVALNIPVIAFTGMEHSLHVMSALAILVGLTGFLEDGRIRPLLVAGIVLSPILRPEGLALSGLACGVVLFHGRFLASVLLGAAGLFPLLGFSLLLVSLGLDPLPSSVISKLPLVTFADMGFWNVAAFMVGYNTGSVSGGLILAIAGFWTLLLIRNRDIWARTRKSWAMVLVLAATAHLVFGVVKEFGRYENYVLVFISGISLILLQPWLLGRWRIGAIGLILALFVTSGINYGLKFVHQGQWAPAAVHLQQAQMAKFAQNYLAEPVAVNDIGKVAYRNPNYVLDLWGLASQEALRLRLSNPEQGWGGPLAQKHGVTVAMIYEKWLATAPPADWQKLGVLMHQAPQGYLAANDVSFYATGTENAAEAVDALRALARDLPEGAVFRFEPQFAAGG